MFIRYIRYYELPIAQKNYQKLIKSTSAYVEKHYIILKRVILFTDLWLGLLNS